MIADASDIYGHPDAASLLAWWGTTKADRDQVFVTHEADAELVACISADRWCADCPECDSGVALFRGSQDAACLGCGAVFTRVDWPAPDELEAVEALVPDLPIGDRDWLRQRGVSFDAIRTRWGVILGVGDPPEEITFEEIQGANLCALYDSGEPRNGAPTLT